MFSKVAIIKTLEVKMIFVVILIPVIIYYLETTP